MYMIHIQTHTNMHTWPAECMHFPKERLIFDSSHADGQYKKTVSNKRLRDMRPDFEFTPFADAMKVTCEWFDANYGPCRK